MYCIVILNSHTFITPSRLHNNIIVQIFPTYYTEVEKFVEKKVQPGLSDEQLNIKLEGVMAEFRNSLENMEDLDREIEQIALDVLPEGWSPAHHELPKDRSKRESTLCALIFITYIIITEKKYDKDILSDQVLQKRQLTLKDLETKAPYV